MKEVVGTQADQVCYSEIKESLPLFEAYRKPNGTLFQKPPAMPSLLTGLQCAAYMRVMYGTTSSTQGTALQSCGCSSVVWCVPGICAVLG